MTRILEGIRVVDQGHVWAGPLLGMFLADLGAEVIKVGAPHRRSGVSMGSQRTPIGNIGGDRGGTAPDDPRAFHGLDRGKMSISIHLGDPRGVDIYKRLVARSDIVLENFSPRVMPGLGLGWNALREVNPRLIMISLSATGATDAPWRDLVTYGPSLAALYGLKSLLGYPGDPQPREDTADLDPTAAGHAMVAVLAALEHRDRTGEGQFIDLAQGEATLQRAAEPLMEYLMNGRDAGPQGNRERGIAPHGAYPCAGEDEWIAIAARTDAQWQALLAAAQQDAAASTTGADQQNIATDAAGAAQEDEASGATSAAQETGAARAALEDCATGAAQEDEASGATSTARGDGAASATAVATRDGAADAPGSLADPRWQRGLHRLKAQDELDAAIAEWTRTQDAESLADRLQAAGVPAARFCGPEQLLVDEDFAALCAAGIDLSAELAAPIRDGALYIGTPWKFDRTPSAITAPVANRGEHDDYVFTELLQIPDPELTALREAGIL